MLDRSLNFRNRFHCTSLGCARNLVDSEVMIGHLLRAGYEYTSSTEDADYLLVNTCGFLESARQEGISVISELFQTKKEGAKIIVAGCMVNKCRAELQAQFPEVHYFLGSGDVDQIVKAVQSKESGGAALSSVRSYLEWGEVPRVVTTPRHYAYLKIAEGCRKRCSFCIIPAIKGPLRSKTEEQVVREFRALLQTGVFEVILIAQDLGDFGKERGEKQGLAHLLRALLKEPGSFWLRLLYLYPDEIDDELIAIMQSDARICPYLDMPIQHINDTMLKSMRRATNSASIKHTLATLRAAMPHISIRTSLMVGFPGETEEQFQELVAFVKEAKLDHVGIFQFSSEKEAHASTLPNHISEEEKQRRYEILADAQQQVMAEKNQRWVGKKVMAIIDGPHRDSPLLLTARHSGQCPEVDSQIIINDARQGFRVGEVQEIEITDTAGCDLIGRVSARKRCNRLALC